MQIETHEGPVDESGMQEEIIEDLDENDFLIRNLLLLKGCLKCRDATKPGEEAARPKGS